MSRQAILRSNAALLQRAYHLKREAWVSSIGWPYPKRRRKRPPKAAQMGWRDTILVGGDKHISGDGLVRDPDSGKLTWAYQVAAFKTHDDYGDQLGLMDKHVSPAVAFVIDPARPDHDPQLVTAFHDPEAAVAYLSFLRNRS